MVDEEPPANNPKIVSLEKILLNIQIQKNPEPILYPKMFNEEYNSIRNPGAFIYNGKCGLLCTVRHVKDNISRLHLAWSNDRENFKLEKKPFIDIDTDSLKGVEDARINKTKKGDYIITFTAFKGIEGRNKINTTRIGLIKTTNFKTHYGRKIILDEYGNNKNCIIFQNKNPSDFYIIHRPFNKSKEERPSARLAVTENFEEVKDLGIFLSPREGMWDSMRVGVNSPPIETTKGLLFLYHGAEETNVYSIGAILVNPENPEEILGRSQEPLITPQLSWETGKEQYSAEVPNVVFGCGTIPITKKTIRFYYSGADKYLNFADIIFP